MKGNHEAGELGISLVFFFPSFFNYFLKRPKMKKSSCPCPSNWDHAAQQDHVVPLILPSEHSDTMKEIVCTQFCTDWEGGIMDSCDPTSQPKEFDNLDKNNCPTTPKPKHNEETNDY